MVKKKPRAKKKRLIVSKEVLTLQNQVKYLTRTIEALNDKIGDLEPKHVTPEINQDIADLINAQERFGGIVTNAASIESLPQGEGTGGKLNDYLNKNFANIVSQEDIWETIGQAKDIANMRLGEKIAHSKEFTKVMVENLIDTDAYIDAFEAADVDTVKTETEMK